MYTMCAQGKFAVYRSIYIYVYRDTYMHEYMYLPAVASYHTEVGLRVIFSTLLASS